MNPLGIATLRSFIDGVVQRPGMYLYPVTLVGFHNLIGGYEAALNDVGVVPKYPITWGFSRWLGAKWEFPQNHLWLGHVQARYGDDFDAILATKKLLDEYFAEVPH